MTRRINSYDKKPWAYIYSGWIRTNNLLIMFRIQLARADGFFELQVLSFDDPRGELADGSCCDVASDSSSPSSSSSSDSGGRVCTDECEVTFVACLMHYQPRISHDGRCTFGQGRSGVVAGNHFEVEDGIPTSSILAGNLSLEEPTLIRFPFDIAWPRTFTLILEAFDVDTNVADGGVIPNIESSQTTPRQSSLDLSTIDSTLLNTAVTPLPKSGMANYQLIERSFHSGIIVPSASWVRLRHNGPAASFLYRIRLQCDENFYGSACMNFCQPRDDVFGHYTCDENGGKVCFEGWTGSNCMIAICRKGCHAIYGYCHLPDECRCRHGWQGELCDECMPYPGCLHGGCVSPWQCDCQEKWGGLLCDQDLDFCATHRPCQNNGLCANEGPNEYSCRCPAGFEGLNCEFVQQACDSYPCANEGRCLEADWGFVCFCSPGWTGPTCQTNVDDCMNSPCQNGGSCSDLVNGYECQCTPQWQGPVCQFDSNECMGQPCVFAFRCRNLVGDYLCDCQPGWTGKDCDVNANDCVGHCLNGATCMDLINSFLCVCRPGFEGVECETDIDECSSNPCEHDGKCNDLVNAYECDCEPGFSGKRCQYDIDLCDPNPCQHGANCFNLLGDYYCACPEGFQGKNCSQEKKMCSESPCQAIDSCTITVSTRGAEGGIEVRPSNVCGSHGVCISLNEDGDFTCICHSGYTGLYCQERIDDCLSDPCQNGGTCINSRFAIQCVCPSGWEGTFCHIGTDECATTPCRNNGTCVDLHADFVCVCPHRWKGKTCNSLESHCDSTACVNGGVCTDAGHAFMCLCPSGWEGTSCQIAVVNSCSGKPCENGATCIPSGEVFTCICKDGFEGPRCNINVDDCRLNPCHNGGKCIDGINWFLCQCADGFAGPDCRININECLSNPCTYGSTCVDGIASFTCQCPLGREGSTCSEVVGYEPAPRPCKMGRHVHAHGKTWRRDCNSCRCEDGEITCTKVWCGPSLCLASAANDVYLTAADDESLFRCPDNSVCVPIPEGDCFTPPCRPWGTCKKLPAAKRNSAIVVPEASEETYQLLDADSGTACDFSGEHYSSDACIHLLLTFNVWEMPVGMTIDTVCSDLRQLSEIHSAAERSSVIIICRRNNEASNSIDLSLSTDTEADAELAGQLGRRIATSLRHPASQSSHALRAVTAIQQLSPALSAESRSDGSTLVIAYVIVLFTLSVFGCFVICFGRRCQRSMFSPPPPPPPPLPLRVIAAARRAAEDPSGATQRQNNYVIGADAASANSASTQSNDGANLSSSSNTYENDTRTPSPPGHRYLVPDCSVTKNNGKDDDYRMRTYRKCDYETRPA
ncbi:protein jagged-1b-like [Diadema setosum]|uniref:protein jagged-1b-like n=1 Tax=Diadema setosum TaxID=31175 RepID=UPI003B3AEB69